MDTKNLVLCTKFMDRLCHWTMVACFFLVALLESRGFFLA